MGVRVFDFRCRRCDHVAEFFIDMATWREGDDVPCPKCHGPAGRQIAAPRAQLEGITGAFPGAADAWERRRASHMAKEQKNLAEHGTYD
jgi:putative FmdB family regulatory protein